MVESNTYKFKIETDIEKLSKIENPVYDEEIFKRCPATLIIGQSESGKTLLLQNLLYKCLLDKYMLDNIFIFSKTIFKDKKNWSYYLRKIDKYKPELLETNIFMKIDKLQHMCQDLQKKSLLGQIDQPILIILDDMIGERQLSSRTSFLSTFLPICRHDNISVIIICQKYNLVSTTIRENCSQIFLGFCTAGVINCLKDIQSTIPIKALSKMYDKVHQDKYQFLVIRKDKRFDNGYFQQGIGNNINPYEFI